MSERFPPIETLVPHEGPMHLLDVVVAWDDDHAVCQAISHSRLTNPLRTNGRLAAIAGIEYAAQAMAVHGSLTGVCGSKGGYLASLRDVTFHGSTLDDVGPVLTIRVDRLNGDATTGIYQFVVGGVDCAVVQGRATVLLIR
jgi:predicted hotdog family 3-hydroxylacyl-ACP dehydratase